MQLNKMAINALPLTKMASSVAIQANNNATTLKEPAKVEESIEAKNGHSGTPQKYDFTNMTYKELNVAAEGLYDEGLLSEKEYVLLTGHYAVTQAMAEKDPQLLHDANNKKVNILEILKENRNDHIKNYGSSAYSTQNAEQLVKTVEKLQFGSQRFHAIG
ncbi:hypothetical protein [Shewanella sp.]|uniref:hypothetical protein n=1 Tax=Shewanella sp. TaxID=50422 RepID=UPI001EB8050B|nr:hypothetical protein [Shewanella sp.]NRB25920.1 hypothetical protein [Shewanella sp.]